jgi:hypothetical protein
VLQGFSGFCGKRVVPAWTVLARTAWAGLHGIVADGFGNADISNQALALAEWRFDDESGFAFGLRRQWGRHFQSACTAACSYAGADANACADANAGSNANPNTTHAPDAHAGADANPNTTPGAYTHAGSNANPGANPNPNSGANAHANRPGPVQYDRVPPFNRAVVSQCLCRLASRRDGAWGDDRYRRYWHRHRQP